MTIIKVGGSGGTALLLTANSNAGVKKAVGAPIQPWDARIMPCSSACPQVAFYVYISLPATASPASPPSLLPSLAGTPQDATFVNYKWQPQLGYYRMAVFYVSETRAVPCCAGLWRFPIVAVLAGLLLLR